MKQIDYPLLSIIFLFLFLLFQSCTTTTRLGPIIPGYFNNSGEGNVVIHANADMKAAGAGLQANYSIQDNMYIGGGLDAFSYKARDIIFYSSERADGNHQ